MTNEPLYYTTHHSAIGELLIVGSSKGIRFLTLLGSEDAVNVAAAHFPGAQPLPGFFESATRAIDAYLTQGVALKLPYDLAGGTALQRMVWLAIAKIPYGETISYSTLAETVGFPRAVRAVASACSANPVPLLIPCHRVLAKDGTLGGFSLGGLDVKEKLLAVESQQCARAA